MKKLNDFGINIQSNTFIIAEIGINHNGNIDQAKKLIDSASKTGCDAVKFQTYITEKRAPKGNDEVFNILKKCELPFEAFLELKKYSEEKNLIFFSTPFDNESVDYLESIDVSMYKIASFDVSNESFLKKISLTKKPLILSVGMANLDEVNRACEILLKENNLLSILHCVSSYPLDERNANLNSIKLLEKKFSNCLIGYSDHTNSIKVPIYAAVMGARIIEKHYMINSEMECVDSPVSITEVLMKEMVKEIRNIDVIKGEERVTLEESEKLSLIFKRI